PVTAWTSTQSPPPPSEPPRSSSQSPRRESPVAPRIRTFLVGWGSACVFLASKSWWHRTAVTPRSKTLKTRTSKSWISDSKRAKSARGLVSLLPGLYSGHETATRAQVAMQCLQDGHRSTHALLGP